MSGTATWVLWLYIYITHVSLTVFTTLSSVVEGRGVVGVAAVVGGAEVGGADEVGGAWRLRTITFFVLSIRSVVLILLLLISPCIC